MIQTKIEGDSENNLVSPIAGITVRVPDKNSFLVND
jgi:hypothetical protein